MLGLPLLSRTYLVLAPPMNFVKPYQNYNRLSTQLLHDKIPARSALSFNLPFYTTSSDILLYSYPLRGLSTGTPGSLSTIVGAPASTAAIEVLVPPLSMYKHLLIRREKKAGFYDEDARGFFGWYKNLSLPKAADTLYP